MNLHPFSPIITKKATTKQKKASTKICFPKCLLLFHDVLDLLLYDVPSNNISRNLQQY